MLAISDAVETLLDDAKERVERFEVVEVRDGRHAPLRPRRRGSPSEVRESGRWNSGDLLDTVVGPGALSRGDGLCQHPEHLAVLGGHAGRNCVLEPRIAIADVML